VALYFAYTRVSTVKQGEQGVSLAEQRHSIEAYAGRHGLEIIRWYEERETAAKRGRRVFTRMLKDLERENARGLIVHKIDRSARNLRDWNDLGDLIDRGVEVHFAHESLDMNSRSGRLSADLLAVIAADYVRNLKEEVRKGVRGRLKQGLYPLPAPIGYLNKGKGKPKEIDPHRGPLVRQLFELYASGRFSLDALRYEVHRRGLSGSAGRPFSKNGIATILHNPFYIGVIRVKRTGETFAGIHEPLIGKALFDAVQARLSGRTYAHVVKHTFPYRRLVHCARCGRSLTGERQKGHAYYRCHDPGCLGTSVREEVLDAHLSALFAQLAFSEEELADLRQLAQEAEEDASTTVAQEHAQLERAIGLCQDRLTRLTDAFLDGAIDKETFDARNAQLIAERQDLRSRLADPRPSNQAAELVKKFELGNTAQRQLHSQNPDEKRESIEIVSSNLIVDGKNLEVRLRFPFDEVALWRGVPSSAPHCTGLRTTSRRPAARRKALRTLFGRVLSTGRGSQRPDVPTSPR
jgi:DNA invertase Pin-like site-specific DNA recombinase